MTQRSNDSGPPAPNCSTNCSPVPARRARRSAERFGDPVVNSPRGRHDRPSRARRTSCRHGERAGGARPRRGHRTESSGPRPRSVVLSGSGDGIIDAAEAGLLSGYELVRSSGDTDDLAAALAEARAMIVTDTNRDQARHWRGSQDTRGHTEPGGPDADVLTATSADQRLAVFDDDADSRRSPSRTAGAGCCVELRRAVRLPARRPRRAGDRRRPHHCVAGRRSWRPRR